MTWAARWQMLAAAGIVLLVSASPVLAVPILKFDDPTAPGGTISHTAGGVATGTGILFQSIQGIGTPLNNGVTLTCVGCTMSFTTGPVVDDGAPTWEFGPGGSVAITGAIPALGVVAGSTLLSGVWTTATVTKATSSGFIFAGAGTDTKIQALYDFFGLNAAFNYGATQIALGTATFTGPSGFTGTSTNSDLDNEGTAAVPEPGAMVLLGTGLLVLAAAIRRRRYDRRDSSLRG